MLLSQRRGRRATVLALRIRNRLWAWIVLVLTPGVATWDGLDRYWLPQIDDDYPTQKHVDDLRGRRRVFETCYRHGDDPSGLKGLNGRRLVEVVHDAPEMVNAKAIFESRLWAFLSARPGTLIDITAALTHLRELWGSAVFNATTRAIACLINGQPLSPQQTRVLHKHVGSADFLLLLCCLRPRQSALRQPAAVRHADAVWYFVGNFSRRWVLARRERRALAHLVDTRLMETREEAPGLIRELALGGFFVRPRPERGTATPEAAPIDDQGDGVDEIRLEARMERGFVFTCARLAAALDENDGLSSSPPSKEECIEAMLWLMHTHAEVTDSRATGRSDLANAVEWGRLPAHLRSSSRH